MFCRKKSQGFLLINFLPACVLHPGYIPVWAAACVFSIAPIKNGIHHLFPLSQNPLQLCWAPPRAAALLGLGWK